MQLAMASQRIRALEANNEQLRASKRRKKVPEDPNDRFVMIDQIIAAREEMDAAEAVAEAEDPDEGMEPEEAGFEPELRRSRRAQIATKRALEAGDYNEGNF
jgi:hypothetical protein